MTFCPKRRIRPETLTRWRWRLGTSSRNVARRPTNEVRFVPVDVIVPTAARATLLRPSTIVIPVAEVEARRGRNGPGVHRCVCHRAALAIARRLAVRRRARSLQGHDDSELSEQIRYKNRQSGQGGVLGKRRRRADDEDSVAGHDVHDARERIDDPRQEHAMLEVPP